MELSGIVIGANPLLAMALEQETSENLQARIVAAFRETCVTPANLPMEPTALT